MIGDRFQAATRPPALGLVALVCLLGVVSPLGCSPPDSAGEAAVWRFAIEEAEGSVQHAYAMKFKERIEEKSNGDVRVIVYPYGALGTSTQMTEQLNMGILQFAMASPGSLGKFIPELQVFLLHFVFDEQDERNREALTDPRVLEAFDKLYAGRGLKLLSIYPEGEMVWTTDRAIRKPADFNGLKMRVMTSPILLAAYRAYGASPTPMPYSEVYSALQLNMIDGQVNPVFAIERQKFYEVTRWMIFPKHAHFITTAAANREFYQQLPPAQQQMVQETVTELDGFIFQLQRQLQIERLKKVIVEKKRKRAMLNIVGDLGPFRQALTTGERHELLDDNPYLEIHPALTEQERQAFRQRSLVVRDVFLQIGGPQADEILELLLESVGGGGREEW